MAAVSDSLGPHLSVPTAGVSLRAADNTPPVKDRACPANGGAIDARMEQPEDAAEQESPLEREELTLPDGRLLILYFRREPE
jgi:hypothetical protein